MPANMSCAFMRKRVSSSYHSAGTQSIDGTGYVGEVVDDVRARFIERISDPITAGFPCAEPQRLADAAETLCAVSPSRSTAVHRARPQPRRYDHFLSQGLIAHDLLKFGADRRKRHMPLPDAGQLFRMANQRVPANEFPSGEARQAFVEQIVRWVITGLSYLGDDAEILFIEKSRVDRSVGARRHCCSNRMSC